MLLADRSYLDPLADALRWDWRSLQRCVLVSRAWRAAMSAVKETLDIRLAARLEELQKSCAAGAATEQAQHQAKLHVLYSITRADVAEVITMKCPPPVVIRVMSLTLHILGTPKDRMKAGWLPPPGLPSRPGGDDYIYWSCVQSSWRKEQLEPASWSRAAAAAAGAHEDAAAPPPQSVGRLRELSVATVPAERLEDLYQRREEPYLLRAEVRKQGGPLAVKLAEWMLALVAEWRVVRDAHPEAPTLLALKQERQRAQKRSERAAPARTEETLGDSLGEGRPAEGQHPQSRALGEAQEHFATHLRVS